MQPDTFFEAVVEASGALQGLGVRVWARYRAQREICGVVCESICVVG